jgi:hypothetical protein
MLEDVSLTEAPSQSDSLAQVQRRMGVENSAGFAGAGV